MNGENGMARVYFKEEENRVVIRLVKRMYVECKGEMEDRKKDKIG